MAGPWSRGRRPALRETPARRAAVRRPPGRSQGVGGGAPLVSHRCYLSCSSHDAQRAHSRCTAASEPALGSLGVRRCTPWTVIRGNCGFWWSTTSRRSSTRSRTSLRYEGFEVEEATHRAGGAGHGPGAHPRPDRARRDAARPRRAGGDPAAAGRRDPGAGPLPHRPGRPRRQAGRADHRRRRLRHQALLPGRDHRPDPGHPAAHLRRVGEGRRDPPLRRPRDGRGVPRGPPGGRPDPAHRHRVQPAALLPA